MSDVSEHGRDWVADVGLYVVGLAAAVLTFTTLRDLAEACGITGSFLIVPLSWLVPVTVDAAGIVAARVWLKRQAGDEAVHFARILAWACIAASVAGNAGQHAMAAYAIRPEWWVVVAVSAVPPAMLGAVVHLAHLVARGHRQATTASDRQDDQQTASDRHETHVVIASAPPAPTAGTATSTALSTASADRQPPRQVSAATIAAPATASARVGFPGPRQDWMTDALLASVIASMRKAQRDRKTFGRPRLMDEHGLNTHKAKTVLAYIDKHELIRESA